MLKNCGIALFIWALLMVTACSEEESEKIIDIADQPEEPVDLAELPEVELHQKHVIRETDERIFGNPVELHTDEHGYIYMPDLQRNKLLGFHPELNTKITIGGEGDGPGEFGMLPRGVTMIGQDQRFYIYDPSNNRISVFDFVDDAWSLDNSITLQDHVQGNPKLLKSDGNIIVGARQSGNGDEEGIITQKANLVSVNREDGELVEEELVEYNQSTMVRFRDGSRMLTGMHPYPRRTLFSRNSDNQLYKLWNEASTINIYDEDINIVDSVSIPLRSVPLTDDDRQDALNNPNYSGGEDAIPETKPTAEWMKVDPSNRIWLRTHQSPEYLVTDNTGNSLGSFDAPENFTVHQVDEQFLYMTGEDEEGRLIAVYEYELP